MTFGFKVMLSESRCCWECPAERQGRLWCLRRVEDNQQAFQIKHIPSLSVEDVPQQCYQVGRRVVVESISSQKSTKDGKDMKYLMNGERFLKLLMLAMHLITGQPS